MTAIRLCRAMASALWLAALAAPGTSGANPSAAPSLDERKSELDELRQRVEQLRTRIARDESSRSEAADQLRETETAISEANRRLRQLAEDRSAAESERLGLDAQSKRLDESTALQQHQLARLLNRRFVAGDADAMRLLLAGEDPNQAARDRFFMTQLSRAKADLIRQLQGVAAEKQRLAVAAEARRARIELIEREQEKQRAALLGEQEKRRALLKSIAAKVQAQRKELGSVQRDAERLTKLVDGLIKLAAERRAKARATPKPTPKPAPEPKRGSQKPTKPDSAPRDADPLRAAGDFARLRGKLPLPVSGTVSGRFGAVRSEGSDQSRWKGLFIAASEGSEVRSVAAGTVVFADWMRGFGNLVIVDHDDDFLSIYAYNQSLLRQPGDAVGAGQAVATVGNSGGAAVPGLYFELRHRGQPFDPGKWLKR